MVKWMWADILLHVSAKQRVTEYQSIVGEKQISPW